jgi:hypothetical protein
METKVKNALHAAILKLLKPLVRILLRNGIPFRTFADLAKWVYVDIAHNEFGIIGRKQTDSRVSIITGLSRKEVRRIKNLKLPSDEAAIYRYNRAARVIAGWVKDRRFLDSRGNPRSLAIEEGQPTFSDLVHIYGGDVPVRAVLDELMDVSAIRFLKNDKIKLQARAYLPAGDEPTLLSILGTDVAYLIKTIDHNLIHKDDGRFFQRKVLYDNVPAEASKKFRLISADKAQKLLEVLDRWLSEHDRDVTPSVKGSGRKKIGLGIYYFEEDLEIDPSSAEKYGGKS